MAQAAHNYSVGSYYVTEAYGAIRVRQESSDAVLATMDDGGHPEIELIPYAEQLANAHVFAAAPELLTALERLLDECAPESDSGIYMKARELAEAAVAKARTEQVSA